MRIAQVIGTVSLSRCHPAFVGATWKVVRPFSLKGLENNTPDGEELVAWDELGTGIGSIVAISEGAEAAMPFKPAKKPLDCYCSCIIDEWHLGTRS
ncbi:MAG: EutN/CcmL family microcompartment protein [Gemmatales bacterium]